jgi:cholesterol transport system auxiliary component
MRKKYWIIGILTILTFAGCSSKNSHAIDIYTLKYHDAPNQNHSLSSSEKTLKITPPKSTKEIRKNKILYAKTVQQREAYAHSRWSDIPNHMIEQFLVTLLNQKGLFKAVIPSTSMAKSDWILESNIEDFYQSFNKDNQSFGVIKIRFFLINQKDKKVISKRYFSVKAPAPTLDAKGGVKALNNALEEIGNQLINWLDQHRKNI